MLIAQPRGISSSVSPSTPNEVSITNARDSTDFSMHKSTMAAVRTVLTRQESETELKRCRQNEATIKALGEKKLLKLAQIICDSSHLSTAYKSCLKTAFALRAAILPTLSTLGVLGAIKLTTASLSVIESGSFSSGLGARLGIIGAIMLIVSTIGFTFDAFKKYSSWTAKLSKEKILRDLPPAKRQAVDILASMLDVVEKSGFKTKNDQTIIIKGMIADEQRQMRELKI